MESGRYYSNETAKNDTNPNPRVCNRSDQSDSCSLEEKDSAASSLKSEMIVIKNEGTCILVQVQNEEVSAAAVDQTTSSENTQIYRIRWERARSERVTKKMASIAHPYSMSAIGSSVESTSNHRVTGVRDSEVRLRQNEKIEIVPQNSDSEIGDVKSLDPNTVMSCQPFEIVQVLSEDVLVVDNSGLNELDQTADMSVLEIKPLLKPTASTPETSKLKLRYQCDMCSVTCSTAGNLDRHRMLHTISSKDDSRYKCDICDKQFLQQCDLKRHRLIHTNSHPHRCQQCNKGFLRENDLKKHIMFHMKIKPHSCEHCAKSFVQRGDLLRHVKSVHLKQSKLACGHCSKKYSTDSTLMRHMQTAHRDELLEASKELLKNLPSAEQSLELVLSSSDPTSADRSAAPND